MLKKFLLVTIAIGLTVVAIVLQMKIFKQRHPNAELLADALQGICGHDPHK